MSSGQPERVLFGLHARENLIGRAVRDHFGGRIDFFERFRQTDRRREHLVGRLREVALHAVHDLGRDVALVGGMTVYAVIDESAMRHVLDDVAGGRRVAPQNGFVPEAVLAHLSGRKPPAASG